MANLPAFVKFLTDNLPSNNASLKGYKRPALALQVAASPSSAPLTREQLWSRIQAYAKPEHGFIVDAGDSWFNAQFLNLPRGARYEAQMSYASIGNVYHTLKRRVYSTSRSRLVGGRWLGLLGRVAT